MILNTATGVQSPSYLDFIRRKGANRDYLLYAIGLCIVQFVIFKLLYPFPDFFNDSFWYIKAATENLDINMWPIGYSKFLSAFHSLTSSDIALVSFQYFFMQLAALHFYFTILYFFPTTRWLRNILLLFLFINPLTLYLGNLIASDALYGALTLLWLTELIWIIKRPRIYHLFTQSILFFLCFTIRNNAYYYPLISALAFILSSQPLWRKITGIVLPIILVIPFVVYTQNVAYKLTGTRQFSLFTGWQLANNALYIYDHITVDSSELSTPESKELNLISIYFFKDSNFLKLNDYINHFEANYYLVASQSPLKIYYALHTPGLTSPVSLVTVKDWGRMSALFEPFGKSIILHHPLAYLKYFILPNTWNYLSPPVSDLQKYNYASSHIDDIIKTWFHYPGNNIYCVSYDWQANLRVYKIFSLFVNIYFLIQFILLVTRIRFVQFLKGDYSLYLLATTYLLINFIFSVCVTINILRYQYIPMYLLLTFGLLMHANYYEYKRKHIS